MSGETTEGPPSDYPCTASFDSLPPELLHKVVAHSIPPDFHSTTFSDRQKTLCSLSLVNHRLRDIAQPRLHEILWIKSCDQKSLDKAFRVFAAEGSKERIRKLILNDNWCDLLDSEDFKRFLNDCTKVESLNFCRWSSVPVGIPRIETLSTLIELNLQGSWTLPYSASFPFLHSFTFDSMALTHSFPGVSPTALPSLRLMTIKHTTWYSGRLLDGTILDRFLPQLDVASLHIVAYKALYRPSFAQYGARILVDAPLGRTFEEDHLALTSQIQHLRLLGDQRQDLPGPVKPSIMSLHNLTVYLMNLTRKMPLESLYLDKSLRAPHSKADVRRLLETCRKRGVEIVWEDQPGGKWMDSQHSEEFLRRSRASRSARDPREKK
ncbi:hypothetical protein JCM16303_002296 [Sporobolomyces ruberrimus]